MSFAVKFIIALLETDDVFKPFRNGAELMSRWTNSSNALVNVDRVCWGTLARPSPRPTSSCLDLTLSIGSGRFRARRLMTLTDVAMRRNRIASESKK